LLIFIYLNTLLIWRQVNKKSEASDE